MFPEDIISFEKTSLFEFKVIKEMKTNPIIQMDFILDNPVVFQNNIKEYVTIKSISNQFTWIYSVSY